MNVLAMEDELENPTEEDMKEYLAGISADAADMRASFVQSKNPEV